MNETGFFSFIFIFFFSIVFSISSLSKLSNSILSSLVENDLGSRSKVSVSPIRLSWSSKNITLSKFWKINLVENKNLLISSDWNFTSSLKILSIVLLIIFVWFWDFFFIKLGWILFRYINVNSPIIVKITKFINKNFFNIERVFKYRKCL